MSAERLRDALQQSLLRLSNRLGELSAWRDRETPGLSDRPGLYSSLLRLRGDPLELACLKRAEDSGDLLLRLYEPHGDRGHTILKSALPIERATLINLLEEPLVELPIKDTQRVKITFTPFQVISLRLALR